MNSTSLALSQYYYIDPFYFNVTGLITTSILSSKPALPASTVKLLISTSDFAQFPALLNLSCPVGGYQIQNITTAANATDYTFFSLDSGLSGDCYFSLQNYPSTYYALESRIQVTTTVPVSLKFYFPLMERLFEEQQPRNLQKRFRRTFKKTRLKDNVLDESY